MLELLHLQKISHAFKLQVLSMPASLFFRSTSKEWNKLKETEKVEEDCHYPYQFQVGFGVQGTKQCIAIAHTHTLLSLSLSLSLKLFFSHTLSLSLSLTHTCWLYWHPVLT